MPQEFWALQCCDCHTFQVQQAKQSAKFTCTICGFKQPIGRAYARSAKARDCRAVVQAYNSSRNAAEAAAHEPGDDQARADEAEEEQGDYRDGSGDAGGAGVKWGAWAVEEVGSCLLRAVRIFDYPAPPHDDALDVRRVKTDGRSPPRSKLPAVPAVQRRPVAGRPSGRRPARLAIVAGSATRMPHTHTTARWPAGAPSSPSPALRRRRRLPRRRRRRRPARRWMGAALPRDQNGPASWPWMTIGDVCKTKLL